MITEAELLSIQQLSSPRSNNPGILVIARVKLARLIQIKIQKRFSIKHLNAAISIYTRGGYATRLNLGPKKYNILAEKAPGFCSWFFVSMDLDPSFYDKIIDEYEKRAEIGTSSIKKRKNWPGKKSVR